MLRTPDPYGTLKALYEARVPYYEQADLHVRAHAEFSVDDMTAQVIEALKTRPDVLRPVSEHVKEVRR